ncbi:transmembrane protein 272-like [Eleutherodactylus coqui]|uniref:transmembrane protein 272-like n=1 Tax=Eleutherodactylus coqui TaxID=57060 RepID=UPI0034632E58
MIVLGSLFIHDCATEPKIPMYLIVAGIVHLFGVVLVILKIVDVKRTFGLEGIVGLTSFCWFIAGSVWVFAIYQDDSKDCNSIVYNFAFGVLILQYVILAFIATFICMSSCWAVFLATTSTENDENVRLLIK